MKRGTDNKIKIMTKEEEEMATQSSILAWEVQRTEEPGGLQSMGSQTATQDRT